VKALVQKRARIARVRRVQHVQAAAVAAAAEGHVIQLESSAKRLAALRDSLTVAPGMLSGAALSNAAELSMRLDQARQGLPDAIVCARAAAADRAAARLEARKKQESAERLDERAAEAFARWAERRMLGGRPRRLGLVAMGGEE
jgi:hypothetical protein